MPRPRFLVAQEDQPVPQILAKVKAITDQPVRYPFVLEHFPVTVRFPAWIIDGMGYPEKYYYASPLRTFER